VERARDGGLGESHALARERSGDRASRLADKARLANEAREVVERPPPEALVELWLGALLRAELRLEHESSAGLEDAPHLCEHALGLVGVVEGVGVHDVEAGVGELQLMEVAG